MRTRSFHSAIAATFMMWSTIGLLLTGCAQQSTKGASAGGSGFFGPRIISANERSVSVEILPIHNESNALAVADAHCKKYGRSAVLTQDRKRGKFNYQCVK